jgi:hypothetical protein
MTDKKRAAIQGKRKKLLLHRYSYHLVSLSGRTRESLLSPVCLPVPPLQRMREINGLEQMRAPLSGVV